MDDHPFDRITLAELRTRQSAKWSIYPADVLPAWVAEMDFPLAAPIKRAMLEAIERNDAGYPARGDLGEVFAGWAKAQWGWRIAGSDVQLVCDVVTGIAEILRVATSPGDGIVIEPPVYPPFASTIRHLGRRVVEVPLVRGGDGRSTNDLAGLEAAYASGARAHLLCSPQNPTGAVVPRTTLSAIGALAERHGVLVLSDEIHAPLTLPGAVHVPFPSVSDAARETGIVLTSASKAWNVAGLKAAMLVASGKGSREVLSRLPVELPFHAGHLGVLAARAAFTEGDAWLAQAIAILDRNRRLLAELLAERLPGAAYVPPSAGYLAWIDLTAVGGGDDPARALLKTGRLAVSPGPTFGPQGRGYARLNIATTRSLLEEAVHRMWKTLAPAV